MVLVDLALFGEEWEVYSTYWMPAEEDEVGFE